MKRLILLCTIFCNIYAEKVLIITHSFNKPHFIEWQYHTFNKFMLDEYEFVVFNDARSSTYRNEVRKICSKYNLQCIEIPQAIHDRPYLHRLPGENYNNSCVRCANVVQYSLDQIGFDHNGLVMIIDSDMFLINAFSLKAFMQNTDLAGVAQSVPNVHYLWNGLVFFNMNTTPNKRSMNWNCGKVNGSSVDVGGHMHHYLVDNPQAHIKHLDVYHTGNLMCQSCRKNDSYYCAHGFEEKVQNNTYLDEANKQFLLKRPVNIEFLVNGHFLHYRGAGWDTKTPQYHKTKQQLCKEFIEAKIEKSL